MQRVLNRIQYYMHDHCYSGKETSPRKAIDSAVKEIPENVKVILQLGYKYKVVNYEELDC